MLKKRKRLIILSITILTLFLFLGVIYKNRNNNTYQLKNKSYYEVTLKPNNYFSNDKINTTKYYIAS